MIKIRYVDPNKISPGLHAAVECHGRSTTVYLLCGLRPQQRRAAFRRLQMSARMGYSPALPAPQLVFARFKDRIRTGLGWVGAVFRSHPAGSAVPLMVVSAGAIAFLLLSTVSVRDGHGPRPPGQLAGAAAPVAVASGRVASASVASGRVASASLASGRVWSARKWSGGVASGKMTSGRAASGRAAPVPGALLEPLPGRLIRAGRAGHDRELLAPAPRGSVGVAAFTSLDAATTPHPADLRRTRTRR
jgi:hypothetical protein